MTNEELLLIEDELPVSPYPDAPYVEGSPGLNEAYYKGRSDMYLWHKAQLAKFKEPVIIDGKTYRVKLVPDEWALPQNPHFCRTSAHPLPIFRGYAQAKIEIPKAITSQIKELE